MVNEAGKSKQRSNEPTFAQTSDSGRKALFLDRDGVINVDQGYVCTPERTEFVDGIFDLVRTANALQYLVIVVTNQAGIARGYYSEADFLRYMEWVNNEFKRRDARIDDVFFCPHHPVEGKGEYLKVCDCRKPKPGMILRAASRYGLNLRRSIMIGDNLTDMDAGVAAGVGNNLRLGESSWSSLGSIRELIIASP